MKPSAERKNDGPTMGGGAADCKGNTNKYLRPGLCPSGRAANLAPVRGKMTLVLRAI